MHHWCMGARLVGHTRVFVGVNSKCMRAYFQEMAENCNDCQQQWPTNLNFADGTAMILFRLSWRNVHRPSILAHVC
jgi:hypothetical protein